MIDNILLNLCNWFLNFIFNNPIAQSNPAILVFLITATPQVFSYIPKDELLVPLLTNGKDASAVVISGVVGNVVSEVILYYLVRKIVYLRKKEVKGEVSIRKFIHRNSYLIFIFTPFIPFSTDLLVMYAGIRRIKIRHLIPPMLVGFSIKYVIFVELVLTGSYFLPHMINCS